MPFWFAGCGMLVAGGFCYRMLVGDGESLVSRKIHRLLRVPPTGSSSAIKAVYCNDLGSA